MSNKKIKVRTFEELKNTINLFYKNHKRVPSVVDYRDFDELPSYSKAGALARDAGVKLNDIYVEIDYLNSPKPSVNYYDCYKDEYVRLLMEKGVQPNIYKIWKENLNLPRPDWLIRHCPNASIHNFYDWYRWVGIPCRQMSKDEATKRIYAMAKSKNEPLQYDDFRGVNMNNVPIGIIRKYWGTINAMKDDLGLTINQERMDTKYQNIEEIKYNIQKVCLEIAKKENRRTITGSDFDNCDYSLSACSLSVKIKKYLKCTLSDYVKSLGYDYVQPGHGLNYDYQDGEHTSSRYEYIFSNYLRSIGLKYNIDYFRSVRYDSFVTGYSGKMDCDYVIKYNNRIIYIEIAGVLESFKTWYIDRRPIERQRSKEKYRRNLLVKEGLLKQSKVEYFILFPCDLTREFFDAILNSNYIATKKMLNGHYKNNIEWGIIDNNVGIVFDYSKIGRDGQPSVIYS